MEDKTLGSRARFEKTHEELEYLDPIPGLWHSLQQSIVCLVNCTVKNRSEAKREEEKEESRVQSRVLPQ
jgi:hypothetical protein